MGGGKIEAASATMWRLPPVLYGGNLRLSNAMNHPTAQIQLPVPKRADARRNHEKLLAAARAVFAEAGASAPLEEVAARAGVGVGTLYRNFATRQALLEAVYVDEVEAIAHAAEELAELPPWEALAEWLRRYVGFAATKRLLMEAILASGPASEVLGASKKALVDAGTSLLSRAQEAGIVRTDIQILDVTRVISGIAVMASDDPEQTERMLRLALDGLRYRS
jgi:AcrR family transcriptional regulator